LSIESCVAVSLQKLCQQNIIFSETQLTEAEVFCQNAGFKDKKMLPIPRAGHKDIMLVGMEQYF